ncbi:MAG: hypothetical protein AAF458_08250 [Pseudomonadota bacterium]
MKNSSTSSSDTAGDGGTVRPSRVQDAADASACARTPDPWRAFLRWTAAAFGATFATLAVFIVVLDPHDHLLIAPTFERAPINSNQRYSYPAVARSEQFDSVVIGTSTARLLKPSRLDPELGGRFANLSMNSATSYEQGRLLDLFLRSRAEVHTVLFGVDSVWCERNASPVRYTPRPFPEWLYDDDPWNDLLHVLNGPTLEQAVRQLQFQLGRREPRFGLDGYRTFLPPPGEYDLGKARRNLYGGDGTPRPREGASGPLSDTERTEAVYGALRNMQGALAAVPAKARIIFWLVPYHHHHLGAPGSKRLAWLDDCKQRIVQLAASRPNTVVLDMMFRSPLTSEDANYWDPLHFSESVADSLPGLFRLAIEDGMPGKSIKRLLPRGS